MNTMNELVSQIRQHAGKEAGVYVTPKALAAATQGSGITCTGGDSVAVLMELGEGFVMEEMGDGMGVKFTRSRT